MSDRDTVQGLSPDDAAAHWLLARDEGRDLAGDAAFASWVRDPDHAEAWARAERIWAEFDADPDPFLEAMRDAALRARPSPLARIEPGLRRFAVAAVLILTLFTGWYALGPRQWMGSATRTFAAGAARTEVALEDGSKVTLEPGARIEVTFSQRRRDLALSAGAARFAVAHDTSRPFVVAARDHRVTALGTQFDVALMPMGLRVYLIEGSVEVTRPNGAVRLAPGDVYEANAGSAPRVAHAEPQHITPTGEGRILEFHGEPLSVAVGDVNRFVTHPIIIGDPGIGALPVMGRFRAVDAEGFVQTLSAIYPIRVVRQKDGSLKLLRRR